MTTEMTEKMFAEWLETYNRLDAKAERWDDQVDFCMEHNLPEDAVRAQEIRDEARAEMRGMDRALEIFGFTAIWQAGKYVVVVVEE